MTGVLSVSQSGVGDRVGAAAPFGYALLSPPLAGRPGRGRCSVLLRRGGALRFRGVLAFFTRAVAWATSLKTLSLGLPAWTVVVLPFPDIFAGFRLRVLAVGAEELAFLDWGAPALAFLRGWRMVITKEDSKVRSLESPVCSGLLSFRPRSIRCLATCDPVTVTPLPGTLLTSDSTR